MHSRQQIPDRFDEPTPTTPAAARFIVDPPDEMVIGSMRKVRG